MRYFGHTCWGRFQTKQSTTQSRHLKQKDFKFQYSVFIFLNSGFHAFVLTKFPFSLFITLSWSYLTDYRHINFQWFLDFSTIVPIFDGESFEVWPVKVAVVFLCVFCSSRRWPIIFTSKDKRAFAQNKKWSFLLKISLINVNYCGFVHIL